MVEHISTYVKNLAIYKHTSSKEYILLGFVGGGACEYILNCDGTASGGARRIVGAV